MVLMLSTSLNLNLSTSICFSDILKTYRCARHADKSQPSASVLEVKKKKLYLCLYSTRLTYHPRLPRLPVLFNIDNFGVE